MRKRYNTLYSPVPLPPKKKMALKNSKEIGDGLLTRLTFIFATALCRMCKQHFAETNQQQKVTPAPMIEVTPCVELEISEANVSK